MKRHFFRIYFFLALANVLTLVQVKAFTFKELDSRHGLSSDYVSDFCQDDDGFVWVATSNGLNLLNGNSFQNYKTYEGTTENFSCMTVAADNNLWLGTLNNGVTVFNRLNNSTRKYNTRSKLNALVGDKVNSILRDSKDRVWIVTSKGLNCYIAAEDSMYYYDLSNISTNLNTDLFSIFEDSKGRIYVGTWWNSILYLNEANNTFQRIFRNNGTVVPKVWSFNEDASGNIWIGTWGEGIFKLHLNKANRFEVREHLSVVNEHFNPDIIFNIVYSIAVDEKQQVWIGTDAGLGVIRHPELSNVNIEWIPLEYGENQFLLKDICKVFIDAEGSLWIGTFEYGMCLASPEGNVFDKYQINRGKREPSTNAFTTFWEYNNTFYVGVETLGFGIYDIEKREFTSHKKLKEYKVFSNVDTYLNAVIECKQNDDEYLWFLTRYMGLQRYDIKNQSLVRVGDFRGSNVSFLLDGENIWLSDGQNLVLFVKDSSVMDSNFPYKQNIFDLQELPIAKPSRIFKDSFGKVWVKSLDGGVMYAEKIEGDDFSYEFKLLDVSGKEKFKNVLVNVFFEDSKHNLWFGTTNQGLWLYSHATKRLEAYSKGPVFNDLSVYGIQEDNFNNIWTSTDKGVFCIYPTTGQVVNYTINDGVQGNAFIENSTYKDAQGRIYFGGHHGFNRIDPKVVKYNTYIPPLAFTSIVVDNKPVYINYEEDEVLTLPHSHKSFSIEFLALSYKSINNNHYSYQLEGVDDNWLNASHNLNRVVYGKLSPGKYTFKLKGSNGNGVWNSVPLKLHVFVKRSPFKTIWAYLIYFVVFSIIIFVVYYFWRKDMILKRAYKEEQEERMRADKLNQFKLSFFTNISHELLTPLSIISNATEQVNLEKKYSYEHFKIISNNTNRLLSLINQLLDFRKTETGTKKLKVSKGGVDDLICSLAENFTSLCEKKKIQFTLSGKVDHELWFDEDFLDKTLHNILSNAFKYTPQGGKIFFQYNVYQNNGVEYLKFEIKDSGTGIKDEEIEKIFTRFYRSSYNQKVPGTGIGLSFARSLVELHKGRIWAINNEDVGATFFVEIPVSKSAFAESDFFDRNRDGKALEFYEDYEPATQTLAIQKMLSKNHNRKVLIVEDNTDMRAILKSYLETHFAVYEAENGLVALKLIESVDVDIIVSDVMMPEMDGITFCKKVKSDISTSHIPVILMTAKRTAEDMIEGYGASADSYLAKPIHMKMLLVRINNILMQCDALKSSSSYENQEIIEKSGIGNIDKEFLENVNRIIKENINNDDFRVSDLYEAFGSSESVVFRKVKALTGKSPNQYVREVKLNIAAQLIKKGGKSVEVCYLCGFTDPSYFSSCFKKQFGVSPSKYMKS